METGVVLRILLLVGIAILLFLPTLWAIRDVAYGKFPTLKSKAIWFALVTLLPPFGAFIYMFLGRKHRLQSAEDQTVQ